MNKQEFFDQLWKVEEILMQLDYLRSRVGNCGKPCEGLDAEDDEGLCPDCCDWFAQVLAEEERLSEDHEYNDIMKKLKQACDQDASGQLKRILNQSREGKVVH